jgi:NDP-sugar pyrophosphorylase family protein
LGTGGALKNAEAQLQEDFVLVNGDTYLAIDYASLVAEFAKLSCLALIVAYSKPETPLSDVPASLLPNNLAVGKDGFVTAYRKREPAGLTHIDAGVVLLKKETLARLPAGQKCSLEEEIYPQLIAERKMLAWITSEPFYDMGSPAGLAALEAKLA